MIADDIRVWFRSGAADGFRVMPDAPPDGSGAFVDNALPELRK